MIRYHNAGAYSYYTAVCHKCGKESRPLPIWKDTKYGLSIDEVGNEWVYKLDKDNARIYFCSICKD